jgi:outer membrane protein TolC
METEKPAVKRHQTKYDAAFRTEAARRVTQDGQAATRVAQALGMFANYTEVLTAPESLRSAQLSGINDQQQRLQAVTNLYRALGGGWQ